MCSVHRAIVDNNNLDGSIGLRQNALERLSQISLAIKNRNDAANQRVFHKLVTLNCPHLRRGLWAAPMTSRDARLMLDLHRTTMMHHGLASLKAAPPANSPRHLIGG